MFKALTLCLLVSIPASAQWVKFSTAPSTRIYDIKDIHLAVGIGTVAPHPTIAIASRSQVAGSPNGLFYSSDWGQNWKTLVGGAADTSANCTSNTCVGSFVLNCAGEIVYTILGTAKPIVRLAGNTTPHLSTRTDQYYRIVKDPMSCTLFVENGNGNVLFSTDGGDNWTDMNTGYAGGQAPGGMNVRPGDGMIFTTNDGQISKRATGNGSSWIGIGGLVNPVCIVFSPDNKVWGCDSNNNPRRWTGVDSAVNDTTQWPNVIVDPAYRFRMHWAVSAGADFYVFGRNYDTGAGPHVYKSTNNGASFTAFESGLQIVAGGETQHADLGCDGALYFATDMQPGTTGAGVYYYSGVAPNTCAGAPPPPTGSSITLTIGAP